MTQTQLAGFKALGDWIEVAPWKSRLLLLIDLDTKRQAATLGDKRTMLANAEGHRLIAVWPGQWSSSARGFVVGDAEKVADVLG